jgi:cytochrome b subunit of formate dehydrogenase
MLQPEGYQVNRNLCKHVFQCGPQSLLLTRLFLLFCSIGLISAARGTTIPNRDCFECHEDKTLTKKDATGKTINLFVDAARYASSSHGSNTCTSCHTDITEVPHPDKFAAEPVACAACHWISVQSYTAGPHGLAQKAGNTNAATCADCHGKHDVIPARMSASRLSHDQVMTTCGKCHPEEVTVFQGSIHGKALARGIRDAPTCTDCHSDHLMGSLKTASALKIGVDVCSRCHASERFNARNNLSSDRVTSFFASYHGMSAKLGSSQSANCVSCHGAHNVLPSSDPLSSVNTNNMVTTCRKCHPEANENFSFGKIHLDEKSVSSTGDRLNWWIKRIYILLIVGVIGGMLVHNLLVFRRKFLLLRKRKERSVIRMTTSQRYQHLFLLTSFSALAITGFALVYPDSWLHYLMGSSETVRRLGHRAAAVVMMALAVYHTIYIIRAKEGRKLVKDIFPCPQDVLDVIGNLRYLIFPRAPKPAFARFSYGEKAEYWAVVWGTVIMGLTGLIIMFKMQITGWAPRWIIDVAITIHYYEAILAVLAIIVWHFYHVIFDPDVYPLNTACLDGRMPEHLYHEEHALDKETLAAVEGEEAKGSHPGGNV